MKRIASLGCLCAMLWVLGPQPALGAVTLRVQSIAAPGVEAHGLVLTMAPLAARPGVFALDLSVRALGVPALGWKRVAVRCSGELLRDAQGRWSLQAPLHVQGAPGGALRDAHLTVGLDPYSETAVVRIVQGVTHFDAALPTDGPLHVQMKIVALPLGWFSGALAALSPGASIRNGAANGMLALDADTQGLRVSGHMGVEGLAAFARGGSVAVQGFGARGDFSLQREGQSSHLDFDGALRGGELLAGSFYAQLPARAVPLRLRLDRESDGRMRIGALRYQDNGALDVDASAAFDAAGSLRHLRVASARIDLARALPRYASTWLQGHGLPGLQGMGQVQAMLDWNRGALGALNVRLQHVDVADTAGRFALAGLDGAIDWRAGVSLGPTTLAWRAASVYRVPLGAARLRLRDRNGLLTLEHPARIPMLSGRMHLQHLSLDPGATRRPRLGIGLAFTGISLGELSGALGWPAFRGTLGGAIPDLRMRGGRIELQGGLSMQLFGGHVDVTRMSLAHLFGAAPELGADLTLRGIELAPLTGVFDFGRITGRLDGSVQDLRLVAWRPVAFAADLHTAGGGRISQRAVKNLTSVGGGGLAGGLQGALLRLFSTFPYKRIGLSCKLSGNVCTMGGIGPADGGGYTIVEGDGLPYIHIIGHQSRVDWPTLVSRLQAATTGQRPVIR